jgi:hypothetical protein
LPEPDPPAGELLVGQRVERPQVDPYGRRLTTDGAVHDLTSSSASFEDGEWRFEEQPLAWRPVAHLPGDEVERLREVIRREGVLDLPEEHAPPGTSTGGSIVTYTVALDGRERSIRLVNLPVAEVPPLAALDEAFQIAVAEAQHPQE